MRMPLSTRLKSNTARASEGTVCINSGNCLASWTVPEGRFPQEQSIVAIIAKAKVRFSRIFDKYSKYI